MNESKEKTPVAIVSLSIDRDLLKRLDDRAEEEGRSRSQMVTRMIKFYLFPKVELSTMYGYFDTDSAQSDVKDR